MSAWLLFSIGLVALLVGGELLVRGAAGLAQRLGLSPLLIGLVVVGFGTSMPELMTSAQAAWVGSPGIAVGNIIGSNIANILLVLGMAALVTPIAVSSRALARDGAILLATAVLFTLVGAWLGLSRGVGVMLLAGLAAYLWLVWREEAAGAPAGHTAAHGKLEAHEELAPGSPSVAPPVSDGGARSNIGVLVLLTLGGLTLLLMGGRWVVDAAITIARTSQISESLIGLTIIAVGTSLPEMVTSLIAAYRRHSDIAFGNVLGSNIYNVLGIGGFTAAIAPTIIPPDMLALDAWVMIAASVLMLIFAYTGMRVGRREGLALIAGYAAYIFVLWPK